VLPGALPCGVRTFLPPSPATRAKSDDHLAHYGGYVLTLVNYRRLTPVNDSELTLSMPEFGIHH
jgi:hypothetical protein